MMRVCSESTSVMVMKSPSPATPDDRAMSVLCFLTVLWSVLCSFFQSIFSIMERGGIDAGRTKLGLDFCVAEEAMLSDEDVGGLMSFCSGDECESEAGLNRDGEETERERSVFEFVEAEYEFQPRRKEPEMMMMDFPVEKCGSDSRHEFVECQFLKFEFPAESPESASVLNLLEDAESPESDPCQRMDDAFDSSEDDNIGLGLHEAEHSESDSDGEFGFDIIQQHQELVQKMKMEPKKAKSRVLPTILEDCESLKMAEDMKPLVLDKRIEHKDLIEDVQRFHKSYAGKMHKLDILNQQTLHALGLIRLKGRAQVDLLQEKKKKKKLSFSALSRKLREPRVSCDEAAPDKSTGNLISKLQLMYVSQLCLSWEILNWQYIKAMELLQLDPLAYRHYNQVAYEFQQFQAALQRLVKNEASQRAGFGGFLQVPAIKDDSLRDKKARKEECENGVTISAMVRIIDKSRRVFYEFLCANEPERTKVVLQDQSNQELFIQAQLKLHKMEKRVKELMRSQSRIAKKISSMKEETPLDGVLFRAQVELKLVARVVSMSEISRDQILWCHGKLDEVNLADRGSYLKPTFLLFPC